MCRQRRAGRDDRSVCVHPRHRTDVQSTWQVGATYAGVLGGRSQNQVIACRSKLPVSVGSSLLPKTNSRETRKCPKCGTVLTIPQPRAELSAGAAKTVSDLLDDAGMRSGIRRCPGCGAELGEAAVLCVMCGYDTRLGRRLKTHVGSVVEVG